MKKQTIISLAVCALSFGAIAAAVSAKETVRADAYDTRDIYVAFGADSAWKSWNAGASDTKVYSWGGSVALTAFPGDAVTEVIISEVHYFKVTIPTDRTNMIVSVWGGEVNQNKTANLDIPTDGKNLFTVTSDNGDGNLQNGNWSVLDTTGETIPTSDFSSWNLTGSVNEWNLNDDNYKFAYDTTNKVWTLTKTLAANTEFKVVADHSWSYEVAHLFASKLNDTAKLETLTGGNVKVKADGDYTFTIKDTLNKDNYSSASVSDVTVSFTPQEVPAVDITSWNLAGTMNEWSTEDANFAFSHDTTNKVYTITTELSAGTKFKAAGNKGWSYSIGSLFVEKINDSSKLVLDGEDVKVVAAGTYTLTIADNLTDKTLSTATKDVVTVSYEESTPEPATKFTQTAAYFSSLSGDAAWSKVYAYAWDGEGTGKVENAAWPGVELSAIGTNELGQTVYSIGDLTDYSGLVLNNGLSGEDERKSADISASTFAEGDDSLYLTGESSPYAAGSYKYDSSKITPSEPTPEPVYTLQIGDAEPVNLSSKDGTAEGLKKEHYVEGLDLVGDTELVFKLNGTKIDRHIGTASSGTDISNVVFTYDTTDTELVVSIKVHNDAEGVGIYLKEWNDGGYSVWIGGYAETPVPEPVYAGKVGTTDIALSTATVDPEYDGEDCLKKFEGVITCDDNAQLSFTKDGVAITTNIGKVETANLSDDLKVVKGGTGLIVQVKIYANWVGIWVSQPADTDLAVVRNFVNTYITSQGAEDYTTIPEADRNAKCVSKYQAAKAAYDALSEAQQDLFDTADEFTNPRAILAEWKAVVDAQSGVKAIARMSNPNMRTIAVVGSILAVGAIAAIGMIIFAKKRKAE
ncbi:MAG: starch-binding protein [Erysipelotrichaceae bacterium]|nr:starch-binding protein [Erysipelotrichaceae bacterium]